MIHSADVQLNEGGIIFGMPNLTNSYILESTELKKSLTKVGCNKRTKEAFDKALWFHLAGQQLSEVLTIAEAFLLDEFMEKSVHPEGFPGGLEGQLRDELGIEFKKDEFDWKSLFRK